MNGVRQDHLSCQWHRQHLHFLDYAIFSPVANVPQLGLSAFRLHLRSLIGFLRYRRQEQGLYKYLEGDSKDDLSQRSSDHSAPPNPRESRLIPICLSGDQHYVVKDCEG